MHGDNGSKTELPGTGHHHTSMNLRRLEAEQGKTPTVKSCLNTTPMEKCVSTLNLMFTDVLSEM